MGRFLSNVIFPPCDIVQGQTIFYFLDDNMHHCRVCSGVCDECVLNKNKCTACRSGQMLEKDTCVPEREPCPAGNYT